MMSLARFTAAATVSIAALLAAGSASASSFAIRSGQSAEGLGMAYAGAASGGIGLGSMAWNLGDDHHVPGAQQPSGTTPISMPTRPMSRRRHPPRFSLARPARSRTATGNIGGDGAGIPASYSAWQLTDRLWIGLHTGAPYGLRSKPENQVHAAQIYGRSAKVQTINVSPTIGYKVNDWLSVGAALQVQYFNTTIKTAAGNDRAACDHQGRHCRFRLSLRYDADLMQGTTIGLAYRRRSGRRWTARCARLLP